MRHNLLRADNSGDHWAVGSNGEYWPGEWAGVLVQLMGNFEQVCVRMTPEQAEDMAAALQADAAKARVAPVMILDFTEVEIQKLDSDAQARCREALRIQSGIAD